LGFFCSYSAIWKQDLIIEIYITGKLMKSKAVNAYTIFIQDFNNTIFTKEGRT
jgi:hypothetical protein